MTQEIAISDILVGAGIITIGWLIILVYITYGYKDEDPESWERTKKLFNPFKWKELK